MHQPHRIVRIIGGAALVAAVGWVAVACGGASDDSTDASPTPATAQPGTAGTAADDSPTPGSGSTEYGPTAAGTDTPVAGEATVGQDGSATPTADTPQPGDDERSDRVIDIDVVGGAVDIADDRVALPLDSTVTVRVRSDVAEELHLHGYDLTLEVGPGGPAELTFRADIPGVFEMELEHSGTFVAELEVS